MELCGLATPARCRYCFASNGEEAFEDLTASLALLQQEEEVSGIESSYINDQALGVSYEVL